MPELHKAIARLMAGRQEQEAPAPDAPALRTLLDLAVAEVSQKERPLLESFARALFSKEGDSLIASGDMAHLAGMTVSAFRFLCMHKPPAPSVRVYEPTMERDGWASVHTVVESVLSDRPFIVDTLRDSIQDAGGDIRLLLHPILGVTRTEQGEVTKIVPPDSSNTRLSFVHLEVAQLQPTVDFEQLLADRLAAVVLVTDDYTGMLDRTSRLSTELRQPGLSAPWSEDAHETASFLDWLANESFVYLGYRAYDIERGERESEMRVREASGLGILRDEVRSRYHTPQVMEPQDLRHFDEPPLLTVTKTNAVSPVRRTEPMDCVRVKHVGANGTVVGESRFLGVFTSKAYQQPCSTLPILRQKLSCVLQEEGAIEESHDYRELVDLFDSFPKEELLASTVQEIRDALRVIVAAEGQSSIRVLCRWDAHHHGLFVMVILPRARFSTELHQRVTAQVRDRLQATILDQHLVLDERMQVRLHYHLVAAPEMLDSSAAEILQQDLNLLLRTWDDQLRHQLAEVHSPVEADRLVRYYGNAFPPAYKVKTGIVEAIADIECLERLVATGDAQIDIEEPREGAEATALKLFLAHERIVLSDFIPVLENLGLRVLDEQFVEMSLPKIDRIRIHTFLVQNAADPRRVLADAAPLLGNALGALRAGRVESDPLNSLVLRAGLDWRAVDLLRAYGEHARQIGVVAGRAALVEALTAHPEQARLLFEFFAAKFDPSTSLTTEALREKAVAQTQATFLASLERVESLVHDRVLRALCAAVAATVRTNFFNDSLSGPEAEAVALKFDCRQLPHLPKPRPMFETYVHGPRVEGIHLRGGPVARGGIRHSDRPDDFRSEILGLMKTQSVKNAVIVPVGAKGGFIVKDKAASKPDRSDVDFAYRAFIGSLLSITDNLRNDRTVPPAGQIAYDGPDPYLVVAADRGTATFSDTANEVAARYGFWLGDAFASGGQNGYDHKKVGITARGAWECVRQHLREMGRDVDREPVTVIGVGDMSGDVFGNGLLHTRTLRLLAAFNHKHIFLDPDPDPEGSYTERERLFRLPGSGWDDYDPALISAGGGVYPRSAKAVTLSLEAQNLLGIEDANPSGEDVIRAILCLDVDLLWNGGVGTYVKASDESHADAQDTTNDAVRIDASSLRAKVVGEGGNLGFTQRARIEFALAGGRINTDAIDNSGGVDLSDNEVNLKIALQAAVAGNEIALEDRNRLLEELTDEVTEGVLIHNRRQALALSLDQRRSQGELAMFRTHAAMLAENGPLDPQLEHIPTREVLRARRTTFLGLTRPELSVLLGYSKLELQRVLLDSELCSDPDVTYFFELYFPKAVKERFSHLLANHPLRQEITSLELANRVVDSMGMTFVTRVASHTGHDPEDIVRAWVAAAAISGASTLIEDIEVLQPPLSIEGEAECYFAIARALERATKWVLETQSDALTIGELETKFNDSVQLLLSAWPDLIDGERSKHYSAEANRLVKLGIGESLAARVAALAGSQDALEITHIASEASAPLPAATEVYLGLPGLIDLDWIRRSLNLLAGGEGRWEQRAVEGLLEGLMYGRRRLTRDVLALRESEDEAAAACLDRYSDEKRGQLERLNRVINDQKGAKQPTLAALLVVMRELGRLAGSR